MFAIEALANPRIRDELGELQLVPPEERVSGAGSDAGDGRVHASQPEGSRFSDGSYGVYYAAQSLETAIAEVEPPPRRVPAPHRRAGDRHRHAPDHRQRRGGAARPARGAPASGRYASVLDPDDYGASQALGRRLRAAGSWGICYPSVRHAGGECVGVFRPRALRHAHGSAAHIALHWDGERITHWYEKRGLRTLSS